MNYLDSVIVVDPVLDEYGTEKIGRQETVKCLIGPARGFSRGGYQEQIDADMIVYFNPSDSFVQEVSERLEGMLVIASLGEDNADAWYRIETCNVGRRNLIDNVIDNVQCNLKKSTVIQTVS